MSSFGSNDLTGVLCSNESNVGSWAPLYESWARFFLIKISCLYESDVPLQNLLVTSPVNALCESQPGYSSASAMNGIRRS